jgi:hypothetical protein
MTKRRQYTAEFKARVALEAVKGEQTVPRRNVSQGAIAAPPWPADRCRPAATTLPVVSRKV